MNAVLWVVQIALAAVFVFTGGLKQFRTKEQLVAMGQRWAQDFEPEHIKAIGLLEWLAAAGLVIGPFLSGFGFLVPLAALGIIALMIGAAYHHVKYNEMAMVAFNAALIVLAAFVAWGRFSDKYRF